MNYNYDKMKMIPHIVVMPNNGASARTLSHVVP